MKASLFLLVLIAVHSGAGGKEINYTGSTPAGITARKFLGISTGDSADFIRWQLVISDNQYQLNCQYGIGKPNTNGFMEGGKNIRLSGKLSKDAGFLHLSAGERRLSLLRLNDNLLQFVDERGKALIGTSGWSYTLCNKKPTSLREFRSHATWEPLPDSMEFQGRTPCPGITARDPAQPCYKLKWSIVFFADHITHEPQGYRMRGTISAHENRRGEWSILRAKDGRITYELKNGRGDKSLYLLRLDDGVLLFTDADGNLLVGNEDFSYTLNRKF